MRGIKDMHMHTDIYMDMDINVMDTPARDEDY